jgi:hypothetical protein
MEHKRRGGLKKGDGGESLTRSKDDNDITECKATCVESPICSREDISEKKVVQLMLLSSRQQNQIVRRKRDSNERCLAAIELLDAWECAKGQSSDNLLFAIQGLFLDNSRDDDPVSDLEIQDLVADRMDDSDDFMTHSHWQFSRNAAVKHMQV